MWAKKQSEVFCFLSVALVRVGCIPWPTGSDSWQTAFSSWSSFFIFIEADSSLLQDYVWHHIETVSFSRTLKLCFCMQFSWNQRLSSNIYWLSDKGLWRFRDSQFLLTCFKRKVVSTQFLDSSQYFFFSKHRCKCIIISFLWPHQTKLTFDGDSHFQNKI